MLETAGEADSQAQRSPAVFRIGVEVHHFAGGRSVKNRETKRNSYVPEGLEDGSWYDHPGIIQKCVLPLHSDIDLGPEDLPEARQAGYGAAPS